MTINHSIGLKVKKLRLDKHMTLKELSSLTNLSTGFLSQIENGKASMAIDTLSKITDVFDVTLPYLFSRQNESSSDMIMRSYDITYHQRDFSCIEGNLTRNKKVNKIQPNLLTLLPYSGQIPTPSTHSGEEFLYVIDGVITLELDQLRETLYPGDSAHFKSTVSHAFWNTTKHIAHVFFAYLRVPEDISAKETLHFREDQHESEYRT